MSTVALASQVVSAFVTRNRIGLNELPGLIQQVHAALCDASSPPNSETTPSPKLSPAQIRRSITPDALISFEDGKPYKLLRRHLTVQGLTPETYRAKWGLPRDYPMTAPSYSQARSAAAKAVGLGTKTRARSARREPRPSRAT